jgi:hypothetical protein
LRDEYQSWMLPLTTDRLTGTKLDRPIWVV